MPSIPCSQVFASALTCRDRSPDRWAVLQEGVDIAALGELGHVELKELGVSKMGERAKVRVFPSRLPFCAPTSFVLTRFLYEPDDV